MLNSAILTDSDTLKHELRKALKLETYGTPPKVVSPISIYNMRPYNTDTL